jgi:hypothetical protein
LPSLSRSAYQDRVPDRRSMMTQRWIGLDSDGENADTGIPGSFDGKK